MLTTGRRTPKCRGTPKCPKFLNVSKFVDKSYMAWLVGFSDSFSILRSNLRTIGTNLGHRKELLGVICNFHAMIFKAVFDFLPQNI